MIRTFKLTKVTVVAVKLKGDNVKTTQIDEFIYHGRKKSKSSIEKMYSEKIKEMNMDSIIIKEEEIQKVLEFELEDLLKISKEITEPLM